MAEPETARVDHPPSGARRRHRPRLGRMRPQQADVRAVDQTLPSIGPADLPYGGIRPLKAVRCAAGSVGAGHGWATHDRVPGPGEVRVLFHREGIPRSRGLESANAAPTRRGCALPADRRCNSPITKEQVATGMTWRQLCDAAVRFSDNTAANLLFSDIGGPGGAGQFIRSIGDDTPPTSARSNRIHCCHPR